MRLGAFIPIPIVIAVIIREMGVLQNHLSFWYSSNGKLALGYIRVVNVQCQQGGDNCGVFAVAMAFDLCEGRDPFLCSYDETLMRSHLEDCFEQEGITRFPQQVTNDTYTTSSALTSSQISWL